MSLATPDYDGMLDAFPTLEPPVRNGLIGILICSSISLCATTTLLITLSYKAFQTHVAARKPGSAATASAMRATYSIHTQGYFWLVNLFVADFVQCLGCVTVAYHLVHNNVLPGGLCTLQGFLIQSGDIASAIWSFIIAVHTFVLLAGGRRWRAWVAENSTAGKGRWFLCLGVWLVVLFIGTIGLMLIQKLYPYKGPFYNNAGAGWCWIDEAYFWERIFFHYLFLFIDMFSLTILYVILFFYIRVQLKNFRKAASSSEMASAHELATWQANLEAGQAVQPTAPQQIITTKTVTVTTEDRPQRRAQSDAERAHRRMAHVALTLLCYPISYICLTMPLSITRLSQFAGKEPSLGAVYAGATIFCCSGLVNVLLYTATRKGIISWNWLWRRRRSSTRSAKEIAPPPPYHPHYPGSQPPAKSDSTVNVPATVSAKPSAISLSTFRQLPFPSPSKSHVDCDSGSESSLEFAPAPRNSFGRSGSDGDRLVYHRHDCVHNLVDGGSLRTSNGSTLLGSCNCSNGPKSPKSPSR